MHYNRALARVTAASAVGALLLLSSAGADEYEFHCPKPGTVITTNNGSLTFTDQEGLVCISRNASGGIVRRLLGIAAPDSAFAKNHGERLFPFKVGNEIEFDYSANSSKVAGSVNGDTIVFYHSNVKVVRQEKLVTAAGIFETYVIEYHAHITNHNIEGAWLYTFWFAPDVGYLVKEIDETQRGYGKNATYEIASLTLPQAASQPNSPTTAPSGSPTASTAPTTPSAAPTKSPPAVATPNAPTPNSTTAQRLQDLKALLDRKLITPAEYEAKRKAILNTL